MAVKWEPPLRRVIPAYLYGAILVLAGAAVVCCHSGEKLIELLRNYAISSHTPVHPTIGFIELDMVGLFFVSLGSATILLAYLSHRFRESRPLDLMLITVFNIFSVYFFLNAYICDDAFITFRTVDNFIHGHGLRWNTIERVQTFTNPLWMFLVSGAYGAAQLIPMGSDLMKMYSVSMILSWCAGLAAVLIAAGFSYNGNRPVVLVAVLAVLFSSRAFVEFTSSGLENPLTYFLIAIFFTRFITDRNPPDSSGMILYISTASLAFVNRMDTVLLFAVPVVRLIYLGYRVHGRGIWKPLTIGSLPAIVWLFFAVVYYGFPFPNSYYAKLGLGSAGVVIEQGVNYFLSILVTDPVTVIVVAAAMIVPVLKRDFHLAAAAAGLPLTIGYAILAGGDFMGGRFLSAPVLLAVLILADSVSRSDHVLREPSVPHKKKKKEPVHSHARGAMITVSVCFVCAVYNVFAPLSPLKTPFIENLENRKEFGFRLFDLPNSLGNVYQNAGYYIPSNPMFFPRVEFPFGNMKFHGITDCRHCMRLREEKVTALLEGGGLQGFCRGPDIQLIDPQGITDPLIARLPVPDISGGFIPGHLSKPVPAGLPESYIEGRNLIGDPKLGAYYKKLRTITQGPLFSLERLGYILELNLPGNSRYHGPYS